MVVEADRKFNHRMQATSSDLFGEVCAAAARGGEVLGTVVEACHAGMEAQALHDLAELVDYPLLVTEMVGTTDTAILAANKLAVDLLSCPLYALVGRSIQQIFTATDAFHAFQLLPHTTQECCWVDEPAGNCVNIVCTSRVWRAGAGAAATEGEAAGGQPRQRSHESVVFCRLARKPPTLVPDEEPPPARLEESADDAGRTGTTDGAPAPTPVPPEAPSEPAALSSDEPPANQRTDELVDEAAVLAAAAKMADGTQARPARSPPHPRPTI